MMNTTKTASLPLQLKQLIEVYTDIMNGHKSQYPQRYFEGNTGYVRARILLLIMLKQYLPGRFTDTEDMYRFFASAKAAHTLRQYKLHIALKALYPTPLHYLHDSLPISQKDDYLFYEYEERLPVYLKNYDDAFNGWITEISKDEYIQNTADNDSGYISILDDGGIDLDVVDAESVCKEMILEDICI